jgi:hypothetical protein
MAPGVRAEGPLLAAPGATARGVMSLTLWATTLDIYIFAKFVPDHIFLQNRDKSTSSSLYIGFFIYFLFILQKSTIVSNFFI